jgi:NAD(P)-dependent dehydrogenase (short-subunit alcohol dehydrogenase family)
MADRLANRVAIVTGGSRGIGASIVEALAAEGAVVVIASLDEARGREAARLVQERGGRAEFVQTDVTVAGHVERLIHDVGGRHGAVDVLVNNAGIHEGAPFWDESQQLWQRLYQVNVMGTVLPSQAAVRWMKEGRGGAIVNIASKAGVVGEPGHAAYTASKGAVIALTRAMAIELAPYRIRVNAVCPGPVLTDMLREAVPSEAGRAELAASTPLGRLGQPVDIAGAVVFLACDESAWCTGQAISVDGGLSVLK